MVESQELDGWRPEAARRPRRGRYAPRGSMPFPGVRAKLILYFVLLVIVVGALGTFAITRLIALSAQERFDSLLREASRRAGDAVVRLERKQLDQLHTMALTAGVWEAYANRDTIALQNLLAPTALNADLQVVSAVSLDGQDLLTLYRQPGSQQLSVSSGANYAGLASVAAALSGQSDAVGDKFSEVATFPSGVYLLTSAPVRDQSDTLVGVLLAGTRLDALLSGVKAETLADVVVLDQNGQVVAATLAEPDGGFGLLALTPEQMPQPGTSASRELQLYSRGYRVLYAPLMVRQSPVGVLGVVLPSDLAASRLATQRNLWLALFVAGTLAIMVIGYSLAQSIAQPVLRLRRVAQAAQEGDLSQRTGLAARDELGEIGQALDDLVERLRAAEADGQRLRTELEGERQALTEAENGLEITRARAAQADGLATLSAVTAGVASEAKNPLRTIETLVENRLEAAGQTDEPLHRDLKAVRDSAARADSLLTALLRFARPAPPAAERQDLRETLAGAVQLTIGAIRDAGAELRVNVPDQPVWVEHDARQIEQVLVNLILNGLRNMPQGGTLTLTVRALDHGAVAAIQDSGPGMPAEELGRLFEPATAALAARPELRASREIIAAQGGRLDAASREGEGSILSVWLPEAQAEATEPELTVATTP